jgi:hypothetical protein
VIGVAVLASVFSANGSYASPLAFTSGLTAALPIGAAILAIGAVIALLVPRTSPAQADGQARAGTPGAAAESAAAA